MSRIPPLDGIGPLSALVIVAIATAAMIPIKSDKHDKSYTSVESPDSPNGAIVLEENLGKVLSVEFAPTAFRLETHGLVITTEKACIIIPLHRPPGLFKHMITRVNLGKEAISRTYQNNKRTIQWENDHAYEY